jgi:hypothetical protein
MTTDPLDQFQIVMPLREPRARRGGRFVLFAGVAGACVLGVGAGLWARPAMNERQMAAAPKTPAPVARPARALQIVVDDRPTPVGAPIQVLPAADSGRPLPVFQPPERQALEPWAPEPRTPEPQTPEPQTPRRDPGSLIRILGPVLALAHEALAQPDLAAPQPKAIPAPRPAVDDSLRLAKAEAVRQARIDAQAEQREQRAEQKAELARAQAAKAAAHRIELAKAARAERLEQVRLAKAEARGHARALAEAREDARQEKLAEAAQARKQQTHLAALVRSLTHILPHKAKPEPPPTLTARVEHRRGHKAAAHEPKVEQASMKTRKPAHAALRVTQASHPVRPHAEPAAQPPRASGLMKVSSHCASRDPGAALVCADPNLGAADRQLSRAYQVARAAGVPDSELRQQQQQWLAARSSAAREAPWAVRDVYLARIAELNGQAREAHGNGY